MRGTLTLLSALVDRGHPDVVRLLTEFVGRGTLLDHHRAQRTTTYTLDHPEFDVEGGHYDLVVTTCIDPVHPTQRGFRLCKLQRLRTGETPITVKEYADGLVV